MELEQQVAETRILQKVNRAHREAFGVKYPGQVEHCLRLTMERLQLNLDKRGGVDAANPDTWSISASEIADLAEAAYLIPDSAICLLSALAIYGLTEEIPRQHWIAIRHGTSAIRNHQIKIIRLRNMELGKIRIQLGGMTVSIFDRERTVVDAFRLLSPEIAIKALKAGLAKRGKDKLNSKKLKEYALEFSVFR